MTQVSKKEIKSILKALLTEAVANLEQAEPSRKTVKLVKKLSDLLSGRVKKDLKRKVKSQKAKADKSAKVEKPAKADKPAKEKKNKKNKKAAPEAA
ncbi:MAG: hypothetical protein U0V64_13085 [Cyclobacteriaceae bacterium]